jgi:hypothetical protein
MSWGDLKALFMQLLSISTALRSSLQCIKMLTTDVKFFSRFFHSLFIYECNLQNLLFPVLTRRGEGVKPVQITGAQGSGARLFCMYFWLSRDNNYSTIVQINPFRPSLSHYANESQSFRFRFKVFARLSLQRGKGNRGKIFHRCRTLSRRP